MRRLGLVQAMALMALVDIPPPRRHSHLEPNPSTPPKPDMTPQEAIEKVMQADARTPGPDVRYMTPNEYRQTYGFKTPTQADEQRLYDAQVKRERRALKLRLRGGKL